MELTFPCRLSRERIFEVLRAKSALLIWMLVLPRLYQGTRKTGRDFERIRNAVFSLGDVFWILDDIVDAAEDLGCGRWSYLTLQSNNIDCAACANAIVLNHILNRGVVLSSAEKLCAEYRNAKKKLGRVTGNLGDFDKIFPPWFRMWAESMTA